MRKRFAFPLALLILVAGNAVVGCGGKDAPTEAVAPVAPAPSAGTSSNAPKSNGQLSRSEAKVLDDAQRGQ